MYFIICDLLGEPVELVTDRDKAWMLAAYCGDSIEEYEHFGAALDRMKGIS